MSRRRHHREDDFGGGDSWLSRSRRRFTRWLEKLTGGERSLERAGRSEPLAISLLLLIPRGVAELFRFLISDWSTSRKGRAFLFALPALGTVAGIAAILSVAAWKLETSRDRFYTGRLEYYQKQEDFEFAKSCALKLVELKPSEQNKYRLALAMRQLDDFPAAFDLMTSIAPEEKVPATSPAAARPADERASSGSSSADGLTDSPANEAPADALALPKVEQAGSEPSDVVLAAPPAASSSGLVFTGYAPAHLWLADLAAFGTDWELSAEERKAKALLHYSAAFELEREQNSAESIYATLRLAELQVQEGNLPAAEETLRTAANKPVLTLLHLQAIAKLLAVLKQQEKLQEIQAIAGALQPRLFRLATEMPDVIEPWQALIDVASQAENYQQADEYVQSALAIAKEPNTRRGLLQLRAAVLMRRAMQMQNVDLEERYLEKFGYLATAVSVDPTNEKLYLAMLEYVDLNEQNPQEDDFLRLALGTGRTPGIVHVVLGIRDAQRNERQAAFNHWEIADTQTDRAEWLCGMFSRLLLQAKSLSTDEFFRFLAICDEHYPDQPMLGLARAEALLLLQQDSAAAIPLLEKLLAANETFLAAREAYITALKASGNLEAAERESLRLKEMLAEAQKQQGRTRVEKDAEQSPPRR